MKEFNVIIYNPNKKDFEPYDILPYLRDQLKRIKPNLRPVSHKDMMKFIEAQAQYQWWGRCEYEIVLAGWPNTNIQKKWDIYKQVMMNLPIITNLMLCDNNKK